MLYQSLLVAFLASTATAERAHRHQHRGLRPSGSGTGSPYGFGNSTGIYTNATGTSTIASTSTDTDVVTVTVAPLSVSSGGSTVAPGNLAAVTTGGTCGASKLTTTVTSTEVVYVTVGASSSSSAAAITSSSVAAVVASSSSSSAVSEAAGAFFASSSSSASSTPVASTTYSTSAVAASSSSAASTSVAAASTVAATSSSTSSSATSTATSTTSSSKRGLAYDDAALTQAFADKGMSWAYNWASASSGDLLSGVEYVPMCWCPSKDSLSDWTSAAQTAIDNGSKYILGFNEPDQTGQCDIDYATAAADHQTYMNQFSGSVKIGSPAVTNGGGSMGLTYLGNFFDACDGKCDVDFLSIHWYNSYSDTVVDDFKSHVSDAITLASDNGISEVWVTEFALTGASDSETASFLEEILTWMDNESAVGRYAFFMCSDGLLISGDSVSDVIGAAYIA